VAAPEAAAVPEARAVPEPDGAPDPAPEPAASEPQPPVPDPVVQSLEAAPAAAARQGPEPQQGPRVVARRTVEEEAAHALALAIDEEPEPRGGSGFLAGFAVAAIAALLAATAYVKHPQIAAAVPQLEAPLGRFVVMVDEGRAALADTVARLRGER
jgi:hypothetical protein